MRHFLVAGALVLLAACGPRAAEVSGELKLWHTVTLTFAGPETSEAANPNPFTDYRFDVVLTAPSGKTWSVPGFYAADGDAAESAAKSGDKWRARFTPDEEGEWSYAASLAEGAGVAQDDSVPGEPLGEGLFLVGPTDKTAPDFRARGMLRDVNERYPVFAGSGERFIKGGADSPENFLAYVDFDGTEDRGGKREGFLHRYEPHVGDWAEGDPAWRDGKGKGIIGALNYLASEGVNSIYFLTQNVDGDGDDVWPWVSADEFTRFDVSKLAQWEIVFEHADRMGIQLHVLTAETENDRLLNGGDLGLERRIYYRELIARFGHHRALQWNLGEETKNTPEQLKQHSRYIHEVDPYDHPVVVHTYAVPENHEEIYAPLLGYEWFDGASMQIRDDEIVHETLVSWIRRSKEAGHPWIVCFDEQRTGRTGVAPDDMDDSRQDERSAHLWATLMAGAAGIEWYFGYEYPNDDVTLEDFRSRAEIWRLTRLAVEFFHKHLPFWEMQSADELTSTDGAFVLAKPREIYAVYTPAGGTATLDLEAGQYRVRWFDPEQGGEPRRGSVEAVLGPGLRSLGAAPEKPGQDWVAVVVRVGS